MSKTEITVRDDDKTLAVKIGKVRIRIETHKERGYVRVLHEVTANTDQVIGQFDL